MTLNKGKPKEYHNLNSMYVMHKKEFRMFSSHIKTGRGKLYIGTSYKNNISRTNICFLVMNLGHDSHPSRDRHTYITDHSFLTSIK